MQESAEKDLIRCRVCSRQFSGQKAIRRHYTLEHEKSNKITCPVCYRDYSSKSALERHHTNKHKEEKTFIKPDLNPYYTMEAQLKAQNAYHDQKQTQQFLQIVRSTGIQPSVSTQEFLEPPTKKRVSRINTINNQDLLSLGLQNNAPALTPRRNPELVFNLETSMTENRLLAASQKLSTLPILSAEDVTKACDSCPTPVRDEPIYNYHNTDINPQPIPSPTSVSTCSSSSSDSSSDSDTSSSSSSNNPITSKHQSCNIDVSTMTSPSAKSFQHTSTNTEIITADNETQTHNQYLSVDSILGTERYKVDYNVLRALTHMMNDLDTNLALDFAQLIHRNF